MAWDDIPRTHSFSLSDFHDFDRCVFRFFVKHHLGKKYELEEGSANMAIGCLLDLAMKKLHQSKAYDLPPEQLIGLIKAAELEMKEHFERNGKTSYYGAQIPFLTPEALKKAQDTFLDYLTKRRGKLNQAISKKTFWDYVIYRGGGPAKLWGGPDSLEMGKDGVPEIVDYKYFEDPKKGRDNLDMDLMPKIYTLLAAQDLMQSGYKVARFRIRSWKDPSDEGIYEEFDLTKMEHIEAFFKDKIDRILRTVELQFCEKPYCKACNSSHREEWSKEIKLA